MFLERRSGGRERKKGGGSAEFGISFFVLFLKI
jgi:hypothetical protein